MLSPADNARQNASRLDVMRDFQAAMESLRSAGIVPVAGRALAREPITSERLADVPESIQDVIGPVSSDGAGRAAGIDGIAADITAQLHADSARELAEGTLQQKDRAPESKQNGVVVTDLTNPAHPIICASPGFERITGHAAADFYLLNCGSLHGEDRDQPALSELREAIRAGRERRVVIRNCPTDGSLFRNEPSVSPVRDDRGASAGTRISDHGIGMTAKQLARCFERFYRADASGNIPGTGLGLALVKESVEIEGGSVELSSRAGEGTTAVVRLPLAEAAAEAA